MAAHRSAKPSGARSDLKSGHPFPALVPLYETDVTRLSVTVTRGESEIEIALDEGRIVAGEQSVPVRELEVELKQGCPEDAVKLARDGCAIRGLWLSTISKSMKGQRLAVTAQRQSQGASTTSASTGCASAPNACAI